MNNQEKDCHYLHETTLKDICLRELGYDVLDYFHVGELDSKTKGFDDLKFFDLIELLVIFSREDARDDFIKRLNTIFKEEGDIYQIHGYMIIGKQNEGLRSVVPLIKEKVLQDKLNEYYSQDTRYSTSNHEFLAKISSEILQLLFSSSLNQKKTADYAKGLCRDVATVWTEVVKVEELSILLSDTVKNAKDLSNKISNVRHMDRTTIPVSSPNFYKLIASKNINIIELVILSLPAEYIVEMSSEEEKVKYLENYNINKGIGYVVKKKDPGEINLDDIPF